VQLIRTPAVGGERRGVDAAYQAVPARVRRPCSLKELVKKDGLRQQRVAGLMLQGFQGRALQAVSGHADGRVRGRPHRREVLIGRKLAQVDFWLEDPSGRFRWPPGSLGSCQNEQPWRWHAERFTPARFHALPSCEEKAAERSPSCVHVPHGPVRASLGHKTRQQRIRPVAMGPRRPAVRVTRSVWR